MKGSWVGYIIAGISLLTSVEALGQSQLKYLELGAYVGTMNYRGDVSSTGDFNAFLQEVRPQAGVLLKYHLNSIWSMGVETGFGKINGHDFNHSNVDRGYEVNSTLFELNAVTDINFTKFGKYYQRNQNTAFVKLGAGMISYSPEVPKNTDFPEDLLIYPNSYFGANFLVGFGWKWRLSMHSFISLDATYHFTNMDNLDGFEIANTTTTNDKYFGFRVLYGYGIF